MSNLRAPFANITSPDDVTSRGVRSRSSHFPERLWNAEGVQEILTRVLVERKCVDPLLLTTVQTIVLYGRKGSGKNTILHTRDEEDTQRFVFLDCFDRVVDWKMRAWNHGKFVEWAQKVIHMIGQLEKGLDEAHSDKSLLIVIQDIHLLTNLRDPVYMNTFTHLMTAIRMAAPCTRSAIRLVMTCADVPAVLPVEFRQLVDQLVYVPLPTPDHCHGIILDWMRLFRSLASREESLKHLVWSIELDDDAVDEDPDHIVNTLTLASRGTTPRELYAFMKRLNDACSAPREDGSTDMNEEFIEKMLYRTEGGGRSIVPYDIEKENSAINKYLGLDFASAAGVAQGNPLTVQGGLVDPVNQPLLTPGQNGSKKKRRHGGEGIDDGRSHLPPELAETLKGEAEKRAKVLAGVAKREALKKRQREEGNDAEHTEKGKEEEEEKVA